MIRVVIFILLGCSICKSYSQSSEAYLIILGGGESLHDAEVVKRRYESDAEFRKRIYTNVHIVLSDTVEGLNPGFYIATMGCHTNQKHAQLIANAANDHIKGVYIRKISSKTAYVTPVLHADRPPFESSKFYNLEGINDYYLADKIDNGERLKALSIRSRYHSDVQVDTSEVSFVKYFGNMEVKYYMAWIPEDRAIVYVSQFQFASIPKDLQVDLDGTMEWTCQGSSHRLDLSEHFKPHEFNETCIYSNGIETAELSGYEYHNNIVKYPRDTYKFAEVLNYHLGKGHFMELKGINYKRGEFLHDGYEIKFLDDIVSIEGDDGHSWESLTIKDNYIVYQSGGGA